MLQKDKGQRCFTPWNVLKLKRAWRLAQPQILWGGVIRCAGSESINFCGYRKCKRIRINLPVDCILCVFMVDSKVVKKRSK